MTRFHVFQAGDGFCGIAWNELGIRRFQLQSLTEHAAARHLMRHEPHAEAAEAGPVARQAIDAARRYFDGTPTSFVDLPLDLRRSDPFFQRVYHFIRRLEWGQTSTYGAIAKALGAGPEMARDVGTAMAINPIALIIPCHRVLAAGNKLGGFSAPGGVQAKLRMLKLEGIDLEPAAPKAAPSQASFSFDD